MRRPSNDDIMLALIYSVPATFFAALAWQLIGAL